MMQYVDKTVIWYKDGVSRYKNFSHKDKHVLSLYRQVPYNMIPYGMMFEPTKDTPNLALQGELWGVFCEDFW